MSIERDAVREPEHMDWCDDCGARIGSPDRVEYRFTADSWATVGCCGDHAEAAARARLR